MGHELGLGATIVVSLISGGLAGIFAFIIQERKLRRDNQLEDSAQRVARVLLKNNWPLRSFKVIRHHLGGFGEDELRKILVRSGAIRFMSKSGFELWGLLERNESRLGFTKIDEDPANPIDDSAIFK
jgi:hypothetical protein